MLLLLAIVSLFVVQMYYYLVVYARIPSFRNMNSKELQQRFNPVSVVVVVKEDLDYIEQVLPKMLAQTYDTFEVVVVDLGADEEFSQRLSILATEHDKLRITKVVQQEQRFEISNKMALNIGIKAASYQNIIITTVDCYPSSDKWLSFMSKGFLNGDVVLGYCGMEQGKGLLNKIIRCSRLMMGIRYLSSAMRRRPYRGMIQNIGFTKDIYFGANGFNYLNLNVGEDDLFIQRIATADNTSIVINPHATNRQMQWGGVKWWFSIRKFSSYSFKFYPIAVRNFIQWELGSRMLFFASCLCAIIWLPFEVKIAVASLLLLRVIIVWFEMWRIRKRLGEGGLAWSLMLYDCYGPMLEFRLWLSRTFRPSSGIWR